MNAHRQACSNCRPHSAGFTVIELTVTLILLGMLMSLVVPLLGTINRQQRETDRRVIAVQLIDNLMERLTAQAYDDLTQPTADQLASEAADTALLPDAKLTVTVEEAGGEPAAKKISITLAWNDSDGVAVSPARLTSYVYSTRGQP